ncbi:glycosyltransferase [Helicobacter pametensis]|uniref:glycosyltransferase n=1 Tax=Helicobacter pametensis TaxID=95149 RepID=UPI000CF059D3|nr:glycosyltransferase [Helicobacter pametensis]
MDSNKIVQSFWYSKDEGCNYLSSIELLCIASYLAHGHEFHLYTYTPNDASMHFLQEQLKECKNYENFVLKNACEILPKSEIFFDDRGSVGIAAFSDYFRFQLLYQKGGWWVDMDTICLRPLDFENPYVFATERKGEGIEDGAATCMIKAPKESEFLAILLKKAQTILQKEFGTVFKLKQFSTNTMIGILLNRLIKKIPNYIARLIREDEYYPRRVHWGVIGPAFLEEMLQEHSQYKRYLSPPSHFCEINYYEAKDFIEKLDFPQGKEMYVMHVWNAMWEAHRLPKDVRYAKDSLIEQLRQQYVPRSILEQLPSFEEIFSLSPPPQRMEA